MSNAIDVPVRLQERARIRIAAIANDDMQHFFRTDLLDGGFEVAVENELAAFDNADLIANVRQLRKDVAGNEDRFSHLAKLLEKAAHLDAGARIETARRFIQ